MRVTNTALVGTNSALVSGGMYSSAQTLSAGQTFTTASTAMSTNGADSVDLMFYFTGNASSAGGAVTFYIAVSYDGTTFETVGTPFAGNITTNTPVAFPGKLDTRNVVALQCIKIINGDGGYGLTAVNVKVFANQ